MLSFVRSIFTDQTGLSLEADLSPVGRVSGRGEIEFRRRPDGGSDVEVEIKGIGDGEIEIFINGTRWRAVFAKSGQFDQTFSTASGAHIPPLREGDRFDVRQSGEVILSGVLQRD